MEQGPPDVIRELWKDLIYFQPISIGRWGLHILHTNRGLYVDSLKRKQGCFTSGLQLL